MRELHSLLPSTAVAEGRNSPPSLLRSSGTTDSKAWELVRDAQHERIESTEGKIHYQFFSVYIVFLDVSAAILVRRKVEALTVRTT